MFWPKFVDLCRSRGVSPNAVAAQCGVKSTGTVSGWKKGAQPRPVILSALADFFGVPVSYFSDDESDVKNIMCDGYPELSPQEQRRSLKHIAAEITRDNYADLSPDQLNAIKLISEMTNDQLITFILALYALRREETEPKNE